LRNLSGAFLLLATFIFSSASAQTRTENCVKANQLYDSLQFKQERKFLNSCIKNDDGFSEYYYLRADCNFEEGKINDAFADIDRAINLAYDSLKYRITKADYYQNSLKYEGLNKSVFVIEFDKELEVVQKAFTIAKNAVDSSTLYNYSAIAKEELGDTIAAFKDMEKSISLNPTDPALWLDLSALYDDIDSISLSLNCAKKALALDSTLSAACTSVGGSYIDMKKYDEALFYLNKSIELDSTDNEVFDTRGYAKMEMGDSLGALKDFQKSIKMQPDDPLSYYDLALLYDRMGEEKKACEALDKSLYWGYTQYFGSDALEMKADICGH
jgi:tetratricopeptide (TPR) repeat protein